MSDGEIHRVGDVAVVVRWVVELARAIHVRPRGDRHVRTEHDLRKAEPAVAHRHDALRIILVRDYVHAGSRALGEVAEQVARRECHDEELFGIVQRRIAAKMRIRGKRETWLAG